MKHSKIYFSRNTGSTKGLWKMNKMMDGGKILREKEWREGGVSSYR